MTTKYQKLRRRLQAEKCDDCYGTGRRVQGLINCPSCRGSGSTYHNTNHLIAKLLKIYNEKL